MNVIFVELLVPSMSQAPAVPIDDEDVIALLSLYLGGRDVATAAWAKMNPHEKQTLRDQAVRIAIMARGAELTGFSSSPDVARMLQWGIISFLADAWERKMLSETDLSESAVRSFYEANRQWYKDDEGAPIPFEKCIARVREDMVRAVIMEKLNELNLH